jgi:hypothetical protein
MSDSEATEQISMKLVTEVVRVFSFGSYYLFGLLHKV